MSKHSSQGVSLAKFALQTGIRKGKLLHYCRTGRIAGAVFDRVSWRWMIHAPAKLITGSQS